MAKQPRPGRPRAATAPRSTREQLDRRGPTRRQISRAQRERRQRRILFIGGTAVFVLIALILAFGVFRERYWRGQETVAVVYGERLSAADLLERARPIIERYQQQLALLRSGGLSQQSLQLEFQLRQLPEQVLNQMIEERVLRREASQRGLEIRPDEVEARIRQLVAESDAASQPLPTPSASPAPAAAAPTASPAATPTPQPTATAVPTLTEDRFGPAYQTYLNQTGLSEARLREAVEQDLLQERLQEQIGQEVPAVQEQVLARHLVFDSQEAATAALERIRGGATVDELAAEQQVASGKAPTVDLGWLPRAGRDPTFDETLFGLQPGQVSDVVQTLRGWEIIQAVERDPARPIGPSLLAEMRQRHYRDWVSQATGGPAVERQLSSEESAWVLQQAGVRL